MSTPAAGPGQDGLRLSDAERDELARALGDHYAAGRLTVDEHSERTGRVYAAKTRGEIPALFADLPGGSPLHQATASGPPAAGPRPAALRPPRAGRHLPLLRLALLVALVALVLTHLPLLLLGLAAWWVLSGMLWRGRARACHRPMAYR